MATKWSDNAVFIPVTVDGSEKLVGIKGVNNVKATISSSLLPYINSNAQLASATQVTGLITYVNSNAQLGSSSQVTGLDASLNSKMDKSANLSDVSNVEISGNNLGFPQAPIFVITTSESLVNPLQYRYYLDLSGDETKIDLPPDNDLPTALRRGVPVIFNNLINTNSGLKIANIRDSSSTPIIGVPPGYSANLYLEDNSTSNGSWSYILYRTNDNVVAYVTDPSFQMYSNVTEYNYLSDSTSLVGFTLPISMKKGSYINVSGIGSGGWQIAQNVSQLIKYVGVSTTPGVTGNVASSNPNASVTLECTVEDLEFTVTDTTGSIILT